jgi:hypothetical protein
MKILRCALLVLAVCAAAYPQTQNLGDNMYFSDAGAVVLGVDATVAVRKLNSPYVMFMAFVAAKDDKSFTIDRNDVVLIYKGQEYHMPTLQEIEKSYKGEKEDAGLYGRFGMELLLFGKLRYYKFPYENEFYPTPGFGPTSWVNNAEVTALVGFKTKLYFKNPGLQKGDEVTIKVVDHKNPESVGQVTLVLK